MTVLHFRRGHGSINLIESKGPGTAEEMAEEGPGECDGFAANPYDDGDFCGQGYSQEPIGVF